MSDMHDKNSDQTLSAENATPLKPDLASARRRMLKRGIAVSPVVLTLVSRPVLAWHCKSPSAWGSEDMNPTTSLRTNEGHNSWLDETWTIGNWANNTTRAKYNKPWNVLKEQCSALNDTSTQDSDGNFDYTKVTLNKFFKCTALTIPAGLIVNNRPIYKLFAGDYGNQFRRAIVVAQLNFYLLNGQTQIGQCLGQIDLSQMASGSFTPQSGGNPWGSEKIVRYLEANYIAVP
ncbi:conserved hypothetical protein [Candidatus Propionivibrio aalborgensis]|uniref:Uncharacterized protein n=1 Tax=Candidatus Propionivibrio aalborgensis TaxID=1860101 RepID=A0A1A8Y0A1_9RHOO|nr:hypothetical protein [Candidatus Propionivibrio aalborgensis]SBT10605.1 conserved hypothetical protein [Candidatus Propionivibrio aalborgensis]